jgi:exodeoxyribonuclease V alpha subunit
MLAAWNEIRKRDGDTWLPLSNAFRAVESNIGGAKVQPRRAVKLGVRGGWLRTHFDAEGACWLAERSKADSEQRLARHIERLRHCPVQLWPRDPLPDLTDHQQGELNKALIGPIALLTGSPGTGKTFTATRLIRAIADAGLMRLIAIAAPTGKAAVRITEVMRAAGLAVNASTIHKLLGPSPDGNGWKFAHDEDSQLPYRLIVVDEASMLDTDLAAALFAALEDGTHVLVVGDTHQLPPVGHGCPLRDMINAGLPTARLSEIKRNAGLIVESCVRVKDGEHFKPLDSLDEWDPASPERNLIHLPCRGNDAIEEKLSDVYYWLAAQAKWDLVKDVQVISSRNETRRRINLLLRDRLNTNPPGERPAFRIGDKIICLRNEFFQSVGPAAKERTFVANGDFATVERFSGRQMTVALSSPSRRVVVPLGRTESTTEEDASDDDVFKKNGCRWDLAYCITTHKSQGCENPVTIVLLDASGLLASRELLYTALSRAKDLCILIGPNSEITRRLNRTVLPDRKTFLAEWLNGEHS